MSITSTPVAQLDGVVTSPSVYTHAFVFLALCYVVVWESHKRSQRHHDWQTPLRLSKWSSLISPGRPAQPQQSRTDNTQDTPQSDTHSKSESTQLDPSKRTWYHLVAGPSRTPSHMIAIPSFAFQPVVGGIIGDVLSAIGNALFDIVSTIIDALVQIFSPLIDAVVFVINQLILGIVEALFDLLLLSLLSFIVIPDPAANPSVQNIFRISFVVVVMFTGAGLMYKIVMNMFFQTQNQSDIRSLVARHARVFLLIVLSRPLLELVIVTVNFMSVLTFPVGYSLSRGGEYLSNILLSFGVFGGILVVILFGTTIAVSALVLYISLAIRQVLVFSVYALLPLLLYGQLFDNGPLRYFKQFGQVLFSLTAVLLFLGVIIGVFLQVGLAMSMYYVTDTTQPADHNLGLGLSGQDSTNPPPDGDLTGVIDAPPGDKQGEQLCAPVIAECTSEQATTGNTANGGTTPVFQYLLGLLFLIVPLWVVITVTVSVIFSYLFRMFTAVNTSRVGTLLGN